MLSEIDKFRAIKAVFDEWEEGIKAGVRHPDINHFTMKSVALILYDNSDGSLGPALVRKEVARVAEENAARSKQRNREIGFSAGLLAFGL